jgi:hypothetical protein
MRGGEGRQRMRTQSLREAWGALSAATLDEHEGDTILDHRFVNVVSLSCPSVAA